MTKQQRWEVTSVIPVISVISVIPVIPVIHKAIDACACDRGRICTAEADMDKNK